MRIIYDPDEWEPVSESRPCTSCDGDMTRCNGGCNGMTSVGQRRRQPEEVARIKAERRKQEEYNIIAQAEAIKLRRSIIG